MIDKETRARAEEILNKARVHQIYNKHVASENSGPAGYYGEVCRDCGMPVRRGDGGEAPRLDMISMARAACFHKFFSKDVIAACVIALVEKDMEWWGEEKVSPEEWEIQRANALSGSIDQGIHIALGVTDKIAVRDAMLATQYYADKLAKFSHHFLGCVDPSIESKILKELDGSCYSDTLAALYIKYNKKPDQVTTDKLMGNFQDYETKCYFSEYMGIVKLNNIRANTEYDALATYSLLKKLKPQKLREFEWVNKRLKLSGYQDLALTHMRDQGDATTEMSCQNALVICKFKSEFQPAVVEKAEKLMAEIQNYEDEKGWIFGDHEAKLKAATSGMTRDTLLLGEARNLEEYMSRTSLYEVKRGVEGIADRILSLENMEE